MSYLARIALVTGISISVLNPLKVMGQDRPEDSHAQKSVKVVDRPAPATPPPGIYIPDGYGFEHTKTTTEDKGGASDDANATAHAGGVHTKGNGKTDAKGSTTAPTVKTPGAAGSGGESSGQGEAKNPPPSEGHWYASPWFWAGVVCELLAAGLFLAPKLAPTLLPIPVPMVVPLGLAVAGGAMIFAAISPAAFTVAILVAVGCLVGPKVWSAIQASQTQHALAVNTLRAQAATSAATADAAAHKSALSETLEATLTDNAQAKAALLNHLDKRAVEADRTTILAAVARDGLNLS